MSDSCSDLDEHGESDLDSLSSGSSREPIRKKLKRSSDKGKQIIKSATKKIKKTKDKKKKKQEQELELSSIDDDDSDDDSDDDESEDDESEDDDDNESKATTKKKKLVENSFDFAEGFKQVEEMMEYEPTEMDTLKRRKLHAEYKKMYYANYNTHNLKRGGLTDADVRFHTLCWCIANEHKAKNGKKWESLPSVMRFYSIGLLPRYNAKKMKQKKNEKGMVSADKRTKPTCSNSTMKYNFDDIEIDDDDIESLVARPRKKKKTTTVRKVLERMKLGQLKDLAAAAELIAFRAYLNEVDEDGPEVIQDNSVEYRRYCYPDTEDMQALIRAALLKAFCVLGERIQKSGGVDLVSDVPFKKSTGVNPVGTKNKKKRKHVVTLVESSNDDEDSGIDSGHYIGLESDSDAEETHKKNKKRKKNKTKKTHKIDSSSSTKVISNAQSYIHPDSIQNNNNNESDDEDVPNEPRRYNLEGELIPIWKVMENMGVNITDENVKKEVRMGTGSFMKQMDSALNITRPMQDNRRLYFENEIPNIKIAIRQSLTKYGVNH